MPNRRNEQDRPRDRDGRFRQDDRNRRDDPANRTGQRSGNETDWNETRIDSPRFPEPPLVPEPPARVFRATETDDLDLPEVPPNPGVWRRFKRWLLGPPRTEARGRYVPSAPTSRFTSPSMGDAYDFTVRIRWVWTGGRYDDPSLIDAVEPVKREVWEEIAVAVRCILRTFPPHQPAEAEAKLNERLTDIMRVKQLAGVTAEWKARAEVSPHEAIRTQQQQAWSTYLHWAAEREMAETMVKDYGELADQWRKLLGQVGIGDIEKPLPPFVARYLVRLAADPSSAAEVVDRLSDHRERKDRELLGTISDAVQGLDNVNLLETDLAYDSALRRLMDWAGLPLPELTERTLPEAERL